MMKVWDPEEDKVILEMVERIGNKWAEIVKHLPGRTVSSVRNRYQRIQKGIQMRERGAVMKNKCHSCGQPKRGHICTAKARIETASTSNGKAPMQPNSLSSMCSVGFSVETHNFCASFTGNQALLAQDLFHDNYAAQQDLLMWTTRPLPELPDPPPSYTRSLDEYRREIAAMEAQKEPAAVAAFLDSAGDVLMSD